MKKSSTLSKKPVTPNIGKSEWTNKHSKKKKTVEFVCAKAVCIDQGSFRICVRYVCVKQTANDTKIHSNCAPFDSFGDGFQPKDGYKFRQTICLCLDRSSFVFFFWVYSNDVTHGYVCLYCFRYLMNQNTQKKKKSKIINYQYLKHLTKYFHRLDRN